ncbi:MAG: hypothetical protein QM723_24575 [Myxococcaceae bacterium]
MGQYDENRRIAGVARVERVEKNDKTEGLDLKRKAKFEAALQKAADEQRKDDQHRRHHTYEDTESRLPPVKKK